MLLSVLILCVAVHFDYTVAQDLRISNLDKKCLLCLCYAASNCDMKVGCDDGYCGPYKLSRKYWEDAGMPTVGGDDIGNEFDSAPITAFEDCAISIDCARKTTVNYFARFGQDCNQDGVTNCDDFLMTNFNGGFQCNGTLLRNEEGSQYAQRYVSCRYEALLVEERLRKL